jgi:nucleoside-diphosphate-sugar epimerase
MAMDHLDLTHHADFAVGFNGLLGNSHAIGDVFHITSDEWLTWDQIHQIMATAAGVPAPHLVHVPSDLIATYDSAWGDNLLGDKTASMIFDNSKVKRIVPEFRAGIPFSQGAREIIDWYDANPDQKKVDAGFNILVDRILTGYRLAWTEKNA